MRSMELAARSAAWTGRARLRSLLVAFAALIVAAPAPAKTGLAESETSPVYTWRLRGPDERVVREFVSQFAGTSETFLWRQDYFYGGSSLLSSIGNGSDWQRGHLFYFPDHLGSTRAIADVTGAIVAQPSFLPYGEEVTDWGDQGALRFAGNERDFVHLDYVHARYYDNAIQRFVTPDAAMSGWNRYAYAGNDPINLVDPTGMFEEPFHGALTYHLALAVGFSQNEAATLALSCAGMDHREDTTPTDLDNLRSGRVALIHFQDPAQALRVFQARARALDGSLGGMDRLGEVLHTLEDVGVPGIPGPHTRGPPGLGIAWGGVGHPWRYTETWALSTPFNHKADQAWNDPEENTRLADEIYGLLVVAAAYQHSKGAPNYAYALEAIRRVVTANDADSINAFLDWHGPNGDQPSYREIQQRWTKWQIDFSTDDAPDAD